ncbi:hypothetical protein Tco_0178617 [Tanacetum coccineum]
MFNFLVDEPEPHPTYDFVTPGPLPGYAGNPNNNNGLIEADVSLLGELRVVANKPMVGLIVDEIAEPIVELEEQVIASVVDMDEDIAMLFGDDDFEDDDSEGFNEEETPGFGVYWAGSARQVPEKEDMRDYWIEISSARDFLGTAPSYTLIRDPCSRGVQRLIALLHCWDGRSPGYLKKVFEVVCRWEEERGAYFCRSVCCKVWVAPGPERQPDAVAGAPAEVDDVPVVNEGGQDDPTPIQAPQQQPPPPPAPSRTMVQRLGRLEEDVQDVSGVGK